MLEKFKDLLPFLLKKVLIPLIIIAPISVIVALLIAEKMVQYANPQLTYKVARIESLRVYAKSDFLPFELKPNLDTMHIGNTHEFSYAIKTNSLGYRMNEFSKDKPEDEFRILMLGDSMTFGYGVEVNENLPSQLEKKLNDYLEQNKIENKKIKIINAGFADGKSPDTYYLYLKKIGLDLKPDLVIVNYFINNDIADLDDTEWVSVDADGLPEKIVSRTTYIDDDYTRLKNEYQNWKYLIPVLKNSHLWILFSTALESKSPETVMKIKKMLNIHDLPLIQEGEVYTCIFDSLCNEKMNSLYEKYFKMLKAIRNLAYENNVPLLFGLLPANPQVKNVNELVGSRLDSSNKTKDEMIKRTIEALKEIEPQSRIKSELEEERDIFVDPLPYMVDSNWQEYYFQKDGHATKFGNEKFADTFFDFLVQIWGINSKI